MNKELGTVAAGKVCRVLGFLELLLVDCTWGLARWALRLGLSRILVATLPFGLSELRKALDYA